MVEEAVKQGRLLLVADDSAAAEASQTSTGKAAVAADLFECSICHELLLDPVVSPCGHDACRLCYEHWCRASSKGSIVVCPLCRSPMPSTLGVCIRLKKTIEALYPADTKRRRNELEGPKLEVTPGKQDEVPGSGTAPMPAPQVPQWHWAHQMAMALYSPMFNPMLHCPHPATAWLMQQQQQQQQGSFGGPHGEASDGAAEVMGVAMAPVTATGLPVLDVICQQRMMLHAAQQHEVQPGEHGDSAHRNSGQCSPQPASSTLNDAAGGEAANPGGDEAAPPRTEAVAAGVPAAVQRAADPRWQSVADVPQRLEVARAIVRLVHARGLQSLLGAATLAAARAVEVALYRSAPSRESYLDLATLESRVAAVVRQRASAAAARRAALHPREQRAAPQPSGLTGSDTGAAAAGITSSGRESGRDDAQHRRQPLAGDLPSPGPGVLPPSTHALVSATV